MSKRKIQASIAGASGYAGGELLRLLLGHPEVAIKQLTSRKYAGEPVTLTHPNLRGQTNLAFSSLSELGKCDLLFVALPNGSSAQYMKNFKSLAGRIIDLGADFRLGSEFVYGLAELHRGQIGKTKLVACGGCEATAVILGLYPLVKRGLLQGGIIADVKIGSSAAGNKPSSATHHPERQGVLRSYKPTNHRHQAEAEQELGVRVEMSATAVNLVRGVLATIHTRLLAGKTEKDVWRAYRDIYGGAPFIRLVKSSRGLYRYPEPKLLWGTNFCDIGFEKDAQSDRLVVLAAIDNLGKGTAGQAVQAMNIMFGFPEQEGLSFPGLHPV